MFVYKCICAKWVFKRLPLQAYKDRSTANAIRHSSLHIYSLTFFGEVFYLLAILTGKMKLFVGFEIICGNCMILKAYMVCNRF